MPKVVLFVTSNRHKFREAEGILRGYPITLKHLPFTYPELQLTDTKKISEVGARLCFRRFKKPLFVEDSGLFIKELKWFPGPFTSYVEKTIGNEGILRLAKGYEAEARSVVSYMDENTLRTFEGRVKGTIVPTKGTGGFGFDPIFLPDGYKKTFGQDQELKNQISHRKRAFEKFGKWMKTYGKNARKKKRKVKVKTSGKSSST
jgi:XTP/dITP diphosphohydrolase